MWYTHKRLGGKLLGWYLGLSENLTHQQMKAKGESTRPTTHCPAQQK